METIRLKHHIQNKLKITLNHKTIRRYKKALNLSVIVRKPKPLAATRAKEKNLINKDQYLIECNFKSDEFGLRQSSDVSYIKCSDGTLYLSAVKDYFNKEIVSFFTSRVQDTCPQYSIDLNIKIINLLFSEYLTGISILIIILFFIKISTALLINNLILYQK